MKNRKNSIQPFAFILAAAVVFASQTACATLQNSPANPFGEAAGLGPEDSSSPSYVVVPEPAGSKVEAGVLVSVYYSKPGGREIDMEENGPVKFSAKHATTGSGLPRLMFEDSFVRIVQKISGLMRAGSFTAGGDIGSLGHSETVWVEPVDETKNVFRRHYSLKQADFDATGVRSKRTLSYYLDFVYHNGKEFVTGGGLNDYHISSERIYIISVEFQNQAIDFKRAETISREFRKRQHSSPSKERPAGIPASLPVL